MHSAPCKGALQSWQSLARAQGRSPINVATAREKEGVGCTGQFRASALVRVRQPSEGWKSRQDARRRVALVEYAAVLADLKMARFGLNGSWRNMATFGPGSRAAARRGHNHVSGHEFLGKERRSTTGPEDVPHPLWVGYLLRNCSTSMNDLGERGGIAIDCR